MFAKNLSHTFNADFTLVMSFADITGRVDDSSVLAVVYFQGLLKSNFIFIFFVFFALLSAFSTDLVIVQVELFVASLAFTCLSVLRATVHIPFKYIFFIHKLYFRILEFDFYCLIFIFF